MTTIKSILEELFDRGERLGRSQWVSEDEKEHAIKEALQQIEQLIQEALPAPSTALDGNEAQTFIVATENYRANLKKVIR